MKASLMRYGFRVILGLTLWGFSCPSLAEAAEPPTAPGTNATSSDAVKLFESGVQAAKASQWEEARKAFLAAWQIKAHWQIAANLGRAEFMLGRYREAAEHLSYFLREAKSLEEEDRKQAEGMLAKARAKVGAVTVSVDIDGAEVLVDGKVVGRAPLVGEIFVEPGSRIVEARGEGYLPVTEAINMTPGSAHRLSLKLQQSSAQLRDSAAPSAQEVPAPMQTAQWKPWAIGASVGLAVAGAVSGVGFMIVAKDKNDDAKALLAELALITPENENTCGIPRKFHEKQCERFDSLLSGQNAFHTASIVSFIIGGIAAAGAISFAVWPQASQQHRMRMSMSISPFLTPKNGGVSMGGSF